MRIAALVFDVDGTLADTEEAHRDAFNAAFEAHGLAWRWSPAQYAELRKATGGKERIAAYVQTLALTAPVRAALAARIADIHHSKTIRYIAQVRAGAIGLRPGVRRLIDEARAAGVRLAIASTTSRQNIVALLEATMGEDAPGWFEVIAAGDAVVRKKPAPDIYDGVLAAMALRADETVAFEDSGRGVAAAKAAGLYTIATPTVWTRDDNFSGADLLLPSLGDSGSPLTGEDAGRVGGVVLGLTELRRLHATRDRTPVRTPRHRGRSARPSPDDGN